MLRRRWSRSRPVRFRLPKPARCSTVVTFLVSARARSIGWAAGSFKIGLIVGAVLGVPAGIGGVYRRYRGYFA